MAATISLQEAGSNNDTENGIRLITLNLPEDEGEGLGFRLTRTLWDPYPWVREVTEQSRADVAGLKGGDCVLQADGKDLLGLPVGQVARLIRGDGSSRGVSLLVWSCGVNPQDDPELLWSCGGGLRGERSRRALSGVLKALSCCICAATARAALCCSRSHIYCDGCWSRLQRCALCRETLPAKDSPYAKNLVAEQVFEAIATEYDIKNTIRKPTETVSARTSPSLSPNVNRKGQYQISMMQKSKKPVQLGYRINHNYSSDPNLSKTFNQETKNNNFNIGENSASGNTGNCQNCQSCSYNNNEQRNEDLCHKENKFQIPKINIENADVNDKCCNNCQQQSFSGLQHKLLARLRPACSMADLQSVSIQTCAMSRSLNNINMGNCNDKIASGSLDNIKNSCTGNCDNPQMVVLTQPVYLLTCDHKNMEKVA